MAMILFSRMDGSTVRLEVLRNMIIAGLGMGLLLPVYTVAVQNAAPRKHMGAATASTTFFRSIGSTLGVAIFGSVLLTNYHSDFVNGLPAGTPAGYCSLSESAHVGADPRPAGSAVQSYMPGGIELLHTLMANVRTALIHGLHLIFFTSAFIMVAAVLLNAFLKNVPLRKHAHDAAPAVRDDSVPAVTTEDTLGRLQGVEGVCGGLGSLGAVASRRSLICSWACRTCSNCCSMIERMPPGRFLSNASDRSLKTNLRPALSLPESRVRCGR